MEQDLKIRPRGCSSIMTFLKDNNVESLATKELRSESNWNNCH